MSQNSLQIDSQILFWAFRYALGRQTYAASEVIATILSNVSNLSQNDLCLYIRDIYAHYKNMDRMQELDILSTEDTQIRDNIMLRYQDAYRNSWTDLAKTLYKHVSSNDHLEWLHSTDLIPKEWLQD